jgi:hypothetical protein
MCYLKVSWGIAILTCSIDISSTNTSNETSNTYTGSTCTSNTCSTKFKPIEGIKLTSCFNLIGVGTIMVLIENCPGYVTNINSSSSSYIPKCKS